MSQQSTLLTITSQVSQGNASSNLCTPYNSNHFRVWDNRSAVLSSVYREIEEDGEGKGYDLERKLQHL